LVDIGRRETEEKRRRHPLFEARIFGKGDIGLDLTAFRCLAPRSRAEEKTWTVVIELFGDRCTLHLIIQHFGVWLVPKAREHRPPR
jgi:hypothetical protein